MDCVFIKCAYNSNTYQFLVLNSSIENIHLNTIMKSMNDTIFEGIIPFNKVQENHLLKKIIEDSLSGHH